MAHEEPHVNADEGIDGKKANSDNNGTGDRSLTADALDFVRDYGLRVFACGPDKKPLGGEGGFYRGSANEAQVAAMFADPRATFIGARMGEHFFAFELDVKDGRDGIAAMQVLEAKYGELPPTLRISSPSGGERRIFTKSPKIELPYSLDKLGSGIEILSEKHGVIFGGPGYNKQTDDLARCPSPWLELILDRPKYTNDGLNLGDDAYAKAALINETEIVATAELGGRMIALNTAASNLGQLIGAGRLDRTRVEQALQAAAKDCGLLKDDGARKVHDTIKGGIDAGILQPRVRQRQEEEGSKDWSELFAKIKSVPDLMQIDFPPLEEFVDGLITTGLTLLIGKPKKGKSFLAYQWALAIADGSTALGSLKCEKAEVLYLALEDSFRRLKARAINLTPEFRKVMPPGCRLITTWPRGDEGIEALEAYLDLQPIGRAVEKDTFINWLLDKYGPGPYWLKLNKQGKNDTVLMLWVKWDFLILGLILSFKETISRKRLAHKGDDHAHLAATWLIVGFYLSAFFQSAI